MTKVIIIPDEGIPEDAKADILSAFQAGESCRWCGGIHQRRENACPRIRKIIFHPNDDRQLREVEFWADSEWDKSGVIFPEDII